MSDRSVARRAWQSFTGGRGTAHEVTRGRDGYPLWRRVLASFVGLDLRPLPAGAKEPEPVRPITVGRFALPSLPVAGALTAAGGDSLVLEASSPDGRTGFHVRRHGGSGYSLELVYRGDAPGPLLSTVTYDDRVLLVPVVRGRFGPAAGYVRLVGFGPGTTWAASVPAPITSGADWDPVTIRGSIAAALNEATRDAWRQVRELVSDEARGVIDDSLR
jgi:hypothetical protein